MQIQLNAVDVFKAAIIFEERGVSFYADAAARFSGRARNLLLQLSKMEMGHARYFSSILGEPPVSSIASDDTDKEENDAFLQSLTSDRIITAACQPDDKDGYDAILEKAMLIEKNSVFFYTTAKEIMQGQMAAGAVDKIIQEEVTHFKMLSEALNDWRRRNKRSGKKTDE